MKSLSTHITEGFVTEAYTKEQAIKDYTAEKSHLEALKKKNVTKVETDKYWIGPHEQPEYEKISIDIAIANIDICLTELRSGKVNPAEYNY
jgi:hypothetical protein